jgi:phenylpropionate dioxygenase-like ring-hydroxylating dioxygenase large terminal subunit
MGHRFQGSEVVLMRDAAGRVLAFDGRCAHRGCSLAGGWSRDDHLVCPYHGWQYDPQGTCVRIPALRAEESIPRQARLRTFPTRERHGFIWLWVAGRQASPDGEVQDIPELDGLTLRDGGDMAFTYATHFTRTIENGIDPTHAAFVHGKSIGRVDPEADFSLEHYSVCVEPGSLYGRMPIKVKKLTGLTRLLLKGDSGNAFKEYRFLYPNVVVSIVHFGAETLAALQAHVPDSDGATTVRVTNGRNFLTTTPGLNRLFDRITLDTGLQISREDAAVISEQEPKQVSFRGSNEVLIESDRILVEYRRMMREHARV